MQITLTKEQVREAFGELRYMGADYCYKYDKETRKKTEEVPGTWRKPRHTTKGRDDDNRGNENFRTPLY